MNPPLVERLLAMGDTAGHWTVAHPFVLLASAVALTILSCYLRSSPARLLKDLRRGIKVDEYDVVIVGGGTSGCILAARLSEDPSTSVCLVESGESSLPVQLSRVPPLFFKFFGTNHLFNFNTTSQLNAGNFTRYWPRAKLLGGCSSVNALIFHHAAPSDYDEWARTGLDGASRWSYESFHKYFLRFENFSPNKTHPGVAARFRGAGGPVETGFSYFSAIGSIFIDACTSAGIPFTADFNTPKGTLGAGKFLTYIDSKGERVSTESAYLTPEVLKRKNLCVLTHASATKIVLESGGVSKRASAVEVSPDQGITRIRIKARKEVILSAGAIHSPQILMLSGMGPAEQLKAHDIPVIVNLPGVGANLLDHAVVDVVLEETRGHSLYYFARRSPLQVAKFLLALGRYVLTGKGPMSTNCMDAAAFFRSSDPTLFPAEAFPGAVEDLTSGPNAPDLEIAATPIGYYNHVRTELPNKPTMGLHLVLLRPQSVGTVQLRSAHPFDPPIIDPMYLSAPNDLNSLLRGMKLIARLTASGPLSHIIRHGEPAFGPNLATASDAVLTEYIRHKLQTLYHPTSTARMAPLEAGGVVDAQLRVHGVPNLRVVDASVFPTIPSGHTAAPTMALAEMAAEMIRQSVCSSGLV
ncbi:GMC oxidoreductase [Mycena epipterygia]|nr:GMC oxidoreductase [Mycena epipterygia]